MIWRGFTLVLVAIAVGLCAWMWLRDQGPYALQRSERSQAGRDADRVLDLMAQSRACSGRCTVELIDRTGPRVWRFRLAAPAWERCFVVNVVAFAFTQQHGLSGLRTATCG